MTYCVGIKLNAGLVFLSDSRTNAGVDNISTFRKMIVYERRATASWCCCRRAT
jgi:putative proteasome-type protease